MTQRKLRDGPGWPDARGWIGLGTFALSVMVLVMLKEDASVREDEFFQTLATLIVGSGLLSVIAWAYGSTKGGTELANKNAETVHDAAATNNANNLTHSATPTEVKVVNAPTEPVPTDNQSVATPAEELPDYARG